MCIWCAIWKVRSSSTSRPESVRRVAAPVQEAEQDLWVSHWGDRRFTLGLEKWDWGSDLEPPLWFLPGKRAAGSLVRELYALVNNGSTIPYKLSKKIQKTPKNVENGGSMSAEEVAVLEQIVPAQFKNFKGLSKLITTACVKPEDIAA